MTGLRSLIRRGDDGGLSPHARRAAVVLAVLTPLLIAGVAVTAIQAGTESAVTAGPTDSATPSPSPSDSATPSPADSASPSPSPSPVLDTPTAESNAPLLPAAVVNDDQFYTLDNADGSQTIVAAGKLLTTQLATGESGQGFRWTLTDAGTASSGLRDGQFAAVVTIPVDFSESYASLSGSDPVQAQLQVQTNGANSYVTELLASALSANLSASVSATATNGFVTSTLSAFTALNTNITTAANGAQALATGATQLSDATTKLSGVLAQTATGAAELDKGAQGLATGMAAIATGTSDLPGYAQLLAEGSSGVTSGIGLLKARLADETAASYAIDQRQKDLEEHIEALSARVPTLTPAEIQLGLQAVKDEAAGIRLSSFGVTLGLGLDALGVNELEKFSTEVSDGSAQFAADLPLLTTSLNGAATGAAGVASGTSQLSGALAEISTGTATLAQNTVPLASNLQDLATGLTEASGKIPSYTEAEQSQLATVVTTPVVTTQSDIDALPTPAAAIAAVAVPLALWIGAFAIYLLLTPFGRQGLASTASTFRVVIGALAPAAILALVQAAVVALVLFAVGAQPAHIGGSILFSVVMSLAFVTLHQGLVALFGQAGRLISLALVVVQIAAAAVIIPNGLSSPVYTGLATVLPLSHAITGMQALIGGGSLAVAGQETLVLVVFAGIGLALSLIAVTRARSRSTVVLPVTA